MGKRKHQRKPSAGGTLTPGLIILLALVGIFATALMVVAILRGAM